MVNRGRQDISEEELGRDLEALEPRLMERSRTVEAGRRIIGEFFFVYAPEARTLTGHGGEDRPSGDPGTGGEPRDDRLTRSSRSVRTSSCTRPSASTLSRVG